VDHRILGEEMAQVWLHRLMDGVMEGKGEGRFRAWAKGKVAKEIQGMLLEGPENVLSQRRQGPPEGPDLARKTQGYVHDRRPFFGDVTNSSGFTSKPMINQGERVMHGLAHMH
jgi:hypothetical protein